MTIFYRGENEYMKKDENKLQTRHISMISIGGIIGAGLFVGSGSVINATGPGAILSYAIAGFLVVLLMRMLGEMAVTNPDSGSFSTYAKEAIGPWAGYTVGWLYWFFWVIVVAIEATAGAAIVHEWVPELPIWLLSLILTFLLTLSNLVSVKSFGEFEYWFSMIKILAIIAFMGIGIAIICGIFPNVPSPGTSNLFGHGGFIPNGGTSVFIGVITVVFSYFGTEIAAIAAGEAKSPQKSLSIAINSVIWRILLFYIGSITVLVTLLPWNQGSLLKSPYVTMLKMANIPGAAEIMNVVILVAVLSCLNSALYTNSRMIHSLAKKGQAPRAFAKVNSRGVPIRAVWISTIASYICAIFSFVSPDKLFLFLINSSGAIGLIVYLSIAISHLRLRKNTPKKNLPAMKMWLFPYLNYFTIAAITIILISMAFIESLRSQIFLTLLVTGLVIFSYFFVRRTPTSAKHVPPSTVGEKITD